MKNKDLSTKYNSQEVEKGKYDFWMQKKYFNANPKSDKPAFSIILPPPNVTAKLHIGHALDTFLQDALIRYKKLCGFDTIFVPGMDHAGISTQVKVEARLKQQGINKKDLSRDEFLNYSWAWKNEFADQIREQWKKLGLGFDYDVEKFTLDDDVSKLVKEIFVDFYKKGLIYKGKKIVNWDPSMKTAISNVEVIYKEVEGEMFYFKYFVENSLDFLMVATTRPETMFADQCVVVNPNDARYTNFIGKKVINPVNNQLINVIADDYVEIEFGTGAMKCTPAHDPNDFEIGLRHNLEKPICLTEDGKVNEMGGETYCDLDRFEARKKIIELCQKAKTLVKIEKITHQVGFSERSGVVVEPYLSNQWFVKMESFGKMILDLQNSEEKINFFPKRFNEVLVKWMENVHDWTISRQLWWGHQIPAWYNKKDAENVYVGIEPPTDIENWTQDEDVLDTWFSSGLWPFAVTMRDQGEASEYFKKYFPISVMVTGFDIIFFWIARMIFQTKEYTNQIPFKDVLIHGLVRDENGIKMSKSLGNGINPIEIIEENGADALRFFLLNVSTPGQDVRYSEAKLKASWNFINKLWNASRYVLMNLDDDFEFSSNFTNELKLNEADKWILTEFSQVEVKAKKLIDKYEFALALKTLYDFVWNTYCSWYIELTKVNLSNDSTKLASQNTLVYVLKNILILLHPFLPFVTEHIYQKMKFKESILLENWTTDKFGYETDYLNIVISLIGSIREFRAINDIKNKTELHFSISEISAVKKELINKNMLIINQLIRDLVNAKVSFMNLENEKKSTIPVEDFVIEIKNEDFIDREKMLNELLQQQKQLIKEISRSENLLSNSNFLNKANPEKIKIEQNKYQEYKQQLQLIENKLLDN